MLRPTVIVPEETVVLPRDVPAQNPGEAPGFLGPYRILERLGEGGFGIVYRAEQTEPIRREVALKVIKPGMDSEEIIRRFKGERQALALMEHPNIASVLDAGDAGRDFISSGFPRTDTESASSALVGSGQVPVQTRALPSGHGCHYEVRLTK